MLNNERAEISWNPFPKEVAYETKERISWIMCLCMCFLDHVITFFLFFLIIPRAPNYLSPRKPPKSMTKKKKLNILLDSN